MLRGIFVTGPCHIIADERFSVNGQTFNTSFVVDKTCLHLDN